MKGAAIFLSLLYSALALQVPLNGKPVYDVAEDTKVISGADQQLTCYDGTNCIGNHQCTIGKTPVPDLAVANMDNRIQSCLYNGIYILYDEKNYNQNNLNVGTVNLKIYLINIYQSN